jgi:Glycosyltransferase family 87
VDLLSRSKSTRVAPISAACALVGLIFLSVAIGPALRSTFRERGPRNDFLSFYTGSRLLGHGELYDYSKTIGLEKQLGLGDTTPMAYIRLPFYAAMLSPLAALGYRTAYAIFQTVCLVSFGLALLLWRRFGSGTTLVLFGCSAAMATAILRGQDVTLVLLFASISAALLRNGRPFSGGAVLALGLIKWHLLWAIPVLVVTRKLVRFGLGFTTAGGILLAWSFWPRLDWPVLYWRALQRNDMAVVHLHEMPNLRALLVGIPGESILLVIGFAVGAALCWRAFRSSCDLDEAIAICLLAGVFFTPHAYSYDCVLLLPAAAVALSSLSYRPALQAFCALGLAMSPALLTFQNWRFVFFGAYLSCCGLLWARLQHKQAKDRPEVTQYG